MKKISMTMVTITVLIFFGLTTSTFAGVFPTIVKTEYGKVEGFGDANDTVAWKGISYAKPPVGKFRWKAPVGPDPWEGVKLTDEFCDICPQYDNYGQFTGSEDCLYLNVWRPDSEETGLPVYFWIHGGGNSTGTGAAEIFNGANIASKSNMVVVTINYRLGPLGWFSHPALRKGKGKALSNSGNFGTLDIIKALKWVKGNIAAFGGDRRNVTIAGVSAGGTNVISLIVSPLAGKHRLFHKAISESGPAIIASVKEGTDDANRVIKVLLVDDGTAVDADDAKDLLDDMTYKEIRKYLIEKTAKELLDAYEPGIGGMFEFPDCFADGIVIHEKGLDALNDPAEYNQIPMILGTNKEEHKLFMGGSYPFFESNYYNKFWSSWITYDYFYQGWAEDATEQYWEANCVDKIVPIAANPSQPDIFVYRFDYGAYNYEATSFPEPFPYYIYPSGFNAWPTVPNYALLFGASHALEVSFFWGNYSFYGLEGLIFRENNRVSWEALTDAMMAYVKNFANTGNPNGPGVEDWAWEPWDGPKRIRLDADLNGADIGMIYE